MANEGSNMSDHAQRYAPPLFDARSCYFLPTACLSTLASLHENFARNFSETLSSLFPSCPSITLANIQQEPLSRFIKSCSPTNMYTLIDLSPLEGQGIISFNIDMCFSIIEELLGGSKEQLSLHKPLSDLQLSVQRKFTKILLDALKLTWNAHLHAEFSITELSAHPGQDPAFSPLAKYVVLEFSYRHLDFSTFFSLALPSQSLRSLETALSEKTPPTVEKKLDLSDINLEIVAHCGSVELSLQEFHALQVHDILILDASVDNPMPVFLQGQKILQGIPGLLQHQKGLVLI